MSDLRSAPLPPRRPDDHSRGPDGGPLLIEYADFECPHCAALDRRLQPLLGAEAATPVRLVFRHFPSRSRHPRSWPAAAASEAAGLQGRFWEMHDLLFADQGRLEDPHLWRRAQEVGLDLERFDSDRRSGPVRERVQRDFDDGVRGGVVTTPTLFFAGRQYAGESIDRLLAELHGADRAPGI